MSIKIVTDSTCDLPEKVVAEYGITVIPLYINAGEQSYLDGIELSRQEFYERLPSFYPPPTTAAPSPKMLQHIYEQLGDKGATEILSIHISISLSAVLNVARMAAQNVRNVSVSVLDSRQLSMGTGFLALAAAKAAAAGQSMREIVDHIKQLISRTHVFAALDTLEFLRRSGRMNRAMAGLGSLLHIKPLLKMYNGEPTSEKVRTSERAVKRLIELLESVGPVEQLALVHTNAPEKAAELWNKVRHLLPNIQAPLFTAVTPVIGSHIGPGAVGFACVAGIEPNKP